MSTLSLPPEGEVPTPQHPRGLLRPRSAGVAVRRYRVRAPRSQPFAHKGLDLLRHTENQGADVAVVIGVALEVSPIRAIGPPLLERCLAPGPIPPGRHLVREGSLRQALPPHPPHRIRTLAHHG